MHSYLLPVLSTQDANKTHILPAGGGRGEGGRGGNNSHGGEREANISYAWPSLPQFQLSLSLEVRVSERLVNCCLRDFENFE